MANIKSSKKKKTATTGKKTPSAVKKPSSRTRASLSERNDKRVKVESGVKGLTKSLHHVRIVGRQVREIYGYVAEETPTTVVFKTRAFLGASRKALFKHIPRTDIVAYEGKLGKSARALVRAPQILAEYKDVTVSYGKDDTILLKTQDGDEIKIVNPNIQNISVEIDGDAS